MSSLGPSRQITKRRTRARMVRDLDLNLPPAENGEPEVSSGSIRPRASRGASVSISRRIGRRLNPALPTLSDFRGSLIDLDTIEDEIQILSSSRVFPEARNHPSRNQPMTVVLDEDIDTSSRRSEQSGTFSFHRPVANVVYHPVVLEKCNAEDKNVMESEPVPPEEPTPFTCPVCLNSLVEASSTVCGHIFCNSCIVASIKAQKKCPTCRRKLNKKNFHRVYLPTS